MKITKDTEEMNQVNLTHKTFDQWQNAHSFKYTRTTYQDRLFPGP